MELEPELEKIIIRNPSPEKIIYLVRTQFKKFTQSWSRSRGKSGNYVSLEKSGNCYNFDENSETF